METRYNWSEFPTWANYAATDPNGDVLVFESKPYFSDKLKVWFADGPFYLVNETSYIGIVNSLNSLEKRPRK